MKTFKNTISKVKKLGFVILASLALAHCTKEEPVAVAKIAAPVNSTPENGKKFLVDEATNAITFRWTPLVPKPKDPVTYKMKVWQLMQGQNGSAAMRTNQPIVTKDVDNLTETVVQGLYNGACQPPYLCSYVWTVQAIDKDGTPIGNNNGTSEPTTFSF